MRGKKSHGKNSESGLKFVNGFFSVFKNFCQSGGIDENGKKFYYLEDAKKVMFFKLEASEFAMSRSYQKKSMSRAHFREFGFTTIRRDIQKQMRGRIKAMEDEEGTPDLPNKIGLGWPLGKNIKFSMREDFSGLGDHKLPFIGRNLKQLHKYGFSKEDIKFIYRYKTK